MFGNLLEASDQFVHHEEPFEHPVPINQDARPIFGIFVKISFQDHSIPVLQDPQPIKLPFMDFSPVDLYRRIRRVGNLTFSSEGMLIDITFIDLSIRKLIARFWSFKQAFLDLPLKAISIFKLHFFYHFRERAMEAAFD